MIINENGSIRGRCMPAELLELQPKARSTANVNYRALEMHQGKLSVRVSATQPWRRKPPSSWRQKPVTEAGQKKYYLNSESSPHERRC